MDELPASNIASMPAIHPSAGPPPPPTEDDEADMEASRAPLISHLTELRRRLVWSIITLFIAFLGCFYFAQPIYNFLARPLIEGWSQSSSHRMIYTALYEQFFTQIKVAFFAALCIAFPVIASQIWMFIAPGLYKRERRAFLPFLIATPVFFLMGAAFVYYFVLPMAIKFFLKFEQMANEGGPAIQLEAKVSEYLSLIMQLIFAFGLCFELPVLLTLLTRIGLISVAGLKEKRRYAVVLSFVIAAILTPPDPLSQIGLAIPLVLLYELSIWSSTLIERKLASERSDDDGQKEGD